MGRVCAVPKCKTGYKSVKEKCSVFAAPKDAELFKKWQAAIPGIVLKQSQHVCEKHFEEKFVLKEWVKHDSEGRIMARVPYLHRRLVEFAVPTIFDNSTSLVPPVSEKETDGVFDGSNSPKDQCEILEEHLLDTSDAERVDAPCPNSCVKLTVPKILDNSTRSVPSFSYNPTDGMFDGLNTTKDQCERLEETMGTPDTECTDASCAIPCAHQETHEVLPVTHVPSAALARHGHYAASTDMRRKNFVLSKITIKPNDSTSNVTSEKNAITIPTSWGVTEYADESGQRVVFSSILRTIANGMIINKTVEVEADKTLRYCVYGRFIDPESCQLPTILTDLTLLPKTLERFKRLNVCQGIGTVNIHHLSVDCVFQDSVQRWRDNDCTILAKQKRCRLCRKMRQRTLQRESRSHKTENIHRVRFLSNPIDRRKLIALRKKISQEKRANNYLKQRVKSLTESLKRKAKEISSIRAEALDNKTVIIYV